MNDRDQAKQFLNDFKAFDLWPDNKAKEKLLGSARKFVKVKLEKGSITSENEVRDLLQEIATTEKEKITPQSLEITKIEQAAKQAGIPQSKINSLEKELNKLKEREIVITQRGFDRITDPILAGYEKELIKGVVPQEPFQITPELSEAPTASGTLYPPPTPSKDPSIGGALAKEVVSKGVGEAAKKFLSGAATKMIGGPVGAISLALIQNKKLRYALVGVVGGTLTALGAGFSIVAGGAIGGTLGFAAGGTGGLTGAVSSIGVGLNAFMVGLGGVVLGAVAFPLIVAIVVVPIIIALILFIINSGAYIVPPSTQVGIAGGVIESPYIEVVKKATPECLNRDACPPLPGQVTYNIQIKAKKGNLSNIRVQNEYQIFGEGVGTVEAPTIDAPEIISSSAPFNFTYSIPIDEELDNSVIYDTLTVTADAGDEQKDALASAIASVIIGNPPASSCPILGGIITTPSYEGAAERGHGSNSYWGGPAGEACGFDIPAFSGCLGPNSSADTDNNNVCKNQASTCAYYGFAADVVGQQVVQLPSLFGKTLNWNYQNRVSIKKGSWGYGYTFTADDGNTTYSLYLGHLNLTTPPNQLASGSVVGSLYQGLSSPHVHIELQINGQWVRPDFLCGGVGP